jgi:hypothetical protein
MPTFYGIRQLRKVTDWKWIVGEKNWVPSHSAYELAHKWAGCTDFPSQFKLILNSARSRTFKDARIDYGIVEFPVFLDTYKAPSRTDLMLYCRTPNEERVIVGIEGKATEPFGEKVSLWICNGSPSPTPTRMSRLQFLSDLLGISFAQDSPLMYQLIHRTASVVSESLLHGARTSLVAVHSFAEDPQDNWLAYQNFLKYLGVGGAKKNELSSSVNLGPRKDVEISFVWVTDRPVGTTLNNST